MQGDAAMRRGRRRSARPTGEARTRARATAAARGPPVAAMAAVRPARTIPGPMATAETRVVALRARAILAAGTPVPGLIRARAIPAAGTPVPGLIRARAIPAGGIRPAGAVRAWAIPAAGIRPA